MASKQLRLTPKGFGRTRLGRSRLGRTPLRALGLRVEGSLLAPVVAAFLAECDRLQLPFRPQVYLSTEWGVAVGSASIGVPFYLARADLIEIQREQTGLVEGVSPSDTLRYLRHEFGHVLDYTYKLSRARGWKRLFGDDDADYVEEYHPCPFSHRFVAHLPGWYAQKHPVEDWAETCGVCLTPGIDWARDHAGSPEALRKLRYCSQVLAGLPRRKAPHPVYELDEEIGTIDKTLAAFYETIDDPYHDTRLAQSMGAVLRATFAPLHDPSSHAGRPGGRAQVATLIRHSAADTCSIVYRVTGYFPERTELLLHQLAAVAQQMDLHYPRASQPEAQLALTALVTALAMQKAPRRAPRRSSPKK